MSVLVIGDGLLGSEIVKQTSWDFISRKKDGIDFTKIDSYINLISNYDTIINCVAFTQTYSEDKKSNREINFESVVNLSDHCVNTNKKLIHISTDYVYKNSKDNACEDDLPLISENWYTYYKLLADEYILLKNNNFLICRCSFKPNPFPHEKSWIDHVGNFDYVNVISDLIIKLINKNAKGLFNVGTDLKSIYELSKQTKPDVIPILKPSKAPSNVTMCTDKLNNFLNNKTNNAN
jgi:dTDP-4-dehydrorhamnose reductase